MFSDSTVRWIRRVSGLTLRGANEPDKAEFGIDSATDTLLYHSSGTHEVLAADLGQTVTGIKIFSNNVYFTAPGAATTGLRRTVEVTDSATRTLSYSESGLMLVTTGTSGTQIFTLPSTAFPGCEFSFVCGHADAEIRLAVATGGRIVGKVSADTNALGFITTTTTGYLKNTDATNVVGDAITVVSDGLLTWYVIAQTGLWAAA